MKEHSPSKEPSHAPDLARSSPPAVLIERFVVSVTESAVFLGLEGIAVASPDGGLHSIPAFCAMLSPANAQALMDSLSTALQARLTLSAHTDNPQ